MKGFPTAGCALAVLLVGLLAHEAECGTEFYLGGEDVGWTNKANIDYNKWLSDYKIKIGDSLIFVNFDTIDHSVVQVDKLGYDTCGKEGQTYDSQTIGPGIQETVAVQILNADGSVNATAEAAEAPKANSALAMPGISWTSQLLIATVIMVVAAIPVLA